MEGRRADFEGGVGQLEVEDSLTGNFNDGAVVIAQCERMIAVQNQPEILLIGSSYGLPGMVPAIAVSTPRQRFKADAQLPSCCTLCKFCQLISNQLAIAQCIGLRVGADPQQVNAQFLHDVELVFCAVEVAC